MPRYAVCAAILLLAACGGEGVSPEQKVRQGQEAVRLFAEACVNRRADPAGVGAWAQANNAQALSGEERQKLPFGLLESDADAAWKIERSGAVYYLTLSPEGCSLKAEKADETALRKQFVMLAEAVPQGARLELRSDQSAQTPFPLRQLAYAWREQGSPQEWVLTANTSSAEQIPVQAALSLSRQTYSAKPVFRQTP